MAVAYNTPEGKFRCQRTQAKRRGIAWDLTFDQWWGLWQQSGKWEQRGPKTGQYVMARHGDVGPYNVENVYICLASENHADAHRNGRIPRKPGKPRQRSQRVVRGWTYRASRPASPYQVSYGDRYIGSFATQAEAEAAYESARAAALSLRSVRVSHALQHACASRSTPLL